MRVSRATLSQPLRSKTNRAPDSIAGIMNAAKGGAPPKPKKRKQPEEVEESDDESGTDESEDDTSDTNTDTEPEDN